MEDVAKRVYPICAIVGTVAYCVWLWRQYRVLKQHSKLTSEYLQYTLDKMKVQDMEERNW